jgi:hypothetical protein
MARQRLIRDEAPADAILVRLLFDGHEDGSALDRATLIADATLNVTEFGFNGLSMWGAAGAQSLESVLARKCRSSRWVALYRAADPSRLHVGGNAIAGRPGGYPWALVEESTDTAVYFRAIEADEARKNGRLELAAS